MVRGGINVISVIGNSVGFLNAFHIQDMVHAEYSVLGHRFRAFSQTKLKSSQLSYN